MSTVQPSQGAIEVAPIEDTSLLAFYRDMNVPERRTFWACAAGWTLDGMDLMDAAATVAKRRDSDSLGDGCLFVVCLCPAAALIRCGGGR